MHPNLSHLFLLSLSFLALRYPHRTCLLVLGVLASHFTTCLHCKLISTMIQNVERTDTLQDNDQLSGGTYAGCTMLLRFDCTSCQLACMYSMCRTTCHRSPCPQFMLDILANRLEPEPAHSDLCLRTQPQRILSALLPARIVRTSRTLDSVPRTLGGSTGGVRHALGGAGNSVPEPGDGAPCGVGHTTGGLADCVGDSGEGVCRLGVSEGSGDMMRVGRERGGIWKGKRTSCFVGHVDGPCRMR